MRQQRKQFSIRKATEIIREAYLTSAPVPTVYCMQRMTERDLTQEDIQAAVRGGGVKRVEPDKYGDQWRYTLSGPYQGESHPRLKAIEVIYEIREEENRLVVVVNAIDTDRLA